MESFRVEHGATPEADVHLVVLSVPKGDRYDVSTKRRLKGRSELLNNIVFVKHSADGARE